MSLSIRNFSMKFARPVSSVGIASAMMTVLSPVTDGSSGTASVFTQIQGVSEGSPIEFTLKAVERIGDGGLHLNYLAKNAK